MVQPTAYVRRSFAWRKLQAAGAVFEEVAGAAVAVRYTTATDEDQTARRLGIAATMVDDRLHALYEAGYVAPTGGGRWLLARDLHTTTVDGLAHALGLHRAGELGPEFPVAAWTPRFNAMMRGLSRAEQNALDVPIGQVLDEPAAPVPDRAPAAYSSPSGRTR